MSKRYKLKLFNEVKTIPEWVEIFPYLWGRDFADPKWGFEEVVEPHLTEQPKERIEVEL